MCTKNMELNRVIKELQTHTEDTAIFRKLINFASSCKESWNDEHLKQWQPVYIHIIEAFILNTENRERSLLASHTLFALLSIQSNLSFLKETFISLLNSKRNEVYIFDKRYNIVENELFKLICAYGYLQVNHNEIYSNDIFFLIFDVIFDHCIRYTKYSYFAYKILCTWLQRTINTTFWSTYSKIEQRLEMIIFSNWCNAINDISKQNSALIFNMYLKIMEKKYDRYLEYLFKHCVDTISWQNEIKYDILAEICEIWDETKIITSRDFLFSLCNSLTKYYLRSPGTKVYLAIVKKLSENEWKKAFGHIMNYLFHHWESPENENHNALQLLFKHWLEPVVKKYRNLLPYLWNLITDIREHILRSHLQKMACEMHIDLSQQAKIECYLNHNKEIVRLNGFAINCYQVNKLYNENRDRFFTIRSFLWHNANSTTVYMRDGIVKYFKIFYTNVLKMCDNNPDCIHDVYYITHWLHEFFLDCFEIGSCYQRKILSLNLYRTILSFTNGFPINKTNNVQNILSISLLEKHLITTGNWKFTNKKSLFMLLRLVLDSALDVKQLATSIILNYFNKDILSDMEKQVLFYTALRTCNSSKFYEIESGAALISILIHWLPLNTLRDYKDYNDCLKYSDFLFNEAKSQLTQMKDDVLKAIVQNKPFYGLMTALLNIAFQNGQESSDISSEFIEKVLYLLEDATDFFLYILSSKSENTEYSSSFAEMGLAINETIKNSEIENINFDDLNLTSAHHVLISCIWMSLKVCCEIACEIGMLMHCDDTVKRSANIIVTVLLRCRHKGVVEAAGTTIGQLTRCLCKKAKYFNLPKTYILRILEDGSMHSLNITRRGAGLSIMFHRIVVSDNRRDRPLLHFAVQKLLDLLDNISDDNLKSIESQHDSPWARRLHFLRALVADKEIHAQLTPYMERISLTCFKYLHSEIWTIRNASLQLFGSIVPRLTGQNYGDTLDFGNGYSINHFVTHYPALADHVMKELHKFSFTFTKFSTALYLHSNIVHILILLSKFSCSACNLIDYSSQEYLSKVKRLLYVLFENPILHVRFLAAKAYAALTDFLQIEFELEKLRYDISSCHNVNLIHGYLLTIKFLKKKLSVESESINLCSNYEFMFKRYTRHASEQSAELLRFREILQIWRSVSKGKQDNSQICYIIEVLFLQSKEFISSEISEEDIFTFNENRSLLSSEKIKPGFFQFIDLFTKLYANYVNHTNNVNIDILHKILYSPCIDQSISFLNHVSCSIPILKMVVKCLLLNEYDHNELLLNAMINYSLKTLKHWPLLDISELEIEKVIENSFIEKLETVRYSNLWSLKCILRIFSRNEIMINKVLSQALELSVHEEEHTRRIAVELTKFAAYRFAELTSKNKLTILHCCLILLKDEITEIREVIIENLKMHVLQRINSEYESLGHDELIYQRLLSEVILEKLNFPMDNDMNLFFVKLFTHSIKNFDSNTIIENPFYHDDNPFYREESKFLNLCFYYVKRKNNNNLSMIGYDNGMHESKYQLQKECYFDDTNLEVVLNTKYVDYLLMKQKLVIQNYR
ncbi:hypothetical protein K0M31_013642 [Melipona bicolor]|uniref:Thyroid adenoma-associated protein n=1 Tax=Melipona bicolor TaxID=60889 RepID=A0AA40KG70_9HYME|nr:hypothetical protein K0M31_013642 [Melipona bicolor]